MFAGLVMPTKPASTTFDPATLALSGWWRGDFGGAPWTGQSSAGTSGGLQFTTLGADPTSSVTTLNGFHSASFNGTEKLGSSVAETSIITTTALTVCVLFKAGSATADTGASTWYDMPALLANDSATRFGVVYSSSGVRIGSFNGSNWDSLAIAANTSNWHLYQGTYDNSQFRARVDSGAFSTLSRTAPSLAGGNIMTGFDPDTGANKYNGQIMEIITAQSVISDTDLDNIKSYINARYALSL